MTYVPQSPEDFVPPLAPNNGVLEGLWDNHAELPDAYWQHVATSNHMVRTVDGNTYAWEFRQRGNAGLAAVELHMVIDVTSTGVYEVSLSNVGAAVSDSGFTSGSGVQDVIIGVTPDSADDAYVITVQRVSGSNDADVLGWAVYSAFPSAPEAIPNYVETPASNPWLTSGYPVSVEHIERLLRGPGAVAADRPHCLLSHCIDDSTLSRIKLPVSPDFRHWGVLGTSGSAARLDQCGYGAVLIEDERPRQVRIDVLIEADFPGNVDPALRIGGVEWVPAVGVWSSTAITLGPGLHDVIASLAVADGESAVWRTIQIWRL